MTELIITEKPAQSQKIAIALSGGKAEKKIDKGVPYFDFEYNKKHILIASAVGHLFVLAETKKTKDYPVFDVEWKPNHLATKNSAYTKKYYDVLKKLSKSAKEFTVATDYDIEGSTIGYNVLKHICNKKDARRMKFSTLTKDELVKSYKEASPHLDFPQINAGEARHTLDYFWGISVSRALTNSIKNATGRYKTMSSGRVQGPALRIIVEKEQEIIKFVPTKYWQLQLFAKVQDSMLEFFHEKDKFLNEEDAKDVYERTKGKNGKISKIDSSKKDIKQPVPFDLTSLQIEAYRVARIQPKKTLEVAQNLYLSGVISYPRTSSNQLPPSIGYKEIIEKLSKQSAYAGICKRLLTKKDLKPHNGTKTDKAHPAIYPTGDIPERMQKDESTVYDLIVRRTIASFGDIATRVYLTMKLDIEDETFITKGSRTERLGWLELYGRFNPYKDEELPNVEVGEKTKTDKLNLLAKETQPPKRYTPASIIKKLEQLGLGTKATRSSIIETLFDRNYISNDSIEATSLGMKTIETLEKYCPEIIDEKLTKHFEEEMEQIQDEKKSKDDVVEEAKNVLVRIFEHFRANEKKIGMALLDSHLETLHEQNLVGNCPKCEGQLKITYSKKNRSYFIACNKYPECTQTYGIPKYALPKPANKFCDACNFPVLKMIRKGKRPYEFCINPECKKKEEYRNSIYV